MYTHMHASVLSYSHNTIKKREGLTEGQQNTILLNTVAMKHQQLDELK